jgi:magnesium chelatase subunit I
MALAYPFSAIVAQEEMKTALLIAAVDQSIGGVLVFGDRGTGKSTAIRALASLMPKMQVVTGCPYNCDPDEEKPLLCVKCKEGGSGATFSTRSEPMPVVDLPLGATEDRVIGSLDLEKALRQGEKAFEPGLLARAHRGFLYIDEVNLLEDHIVDALLDVAASGENVVEREGLSVRHPARFVLVGSGNPEEGELRPQLLDRFGMSVDVKTPPDLATRVKIVQLRDEFERDREAFVAKWRRKDGAIRRKVTQARDRLSQVELAPDLLELAATLCMALGTDGLRGELTLLRAARALASLEARDSVTAAELRVVAPSVLRHRLRRDPLDESGSGVRIDRALEEILGP